MNCCEGVGLRSADVTFRTGMVRAIKIIFAAQLFNRIVPGLGDTGYILDKTGFASIDSGTQAGGYRRSYPRCGY